MHGRISLRRSPNEGVSARLAIGAHVATNLMIAFFQAPMLPDDPEVTGGLDETVIEVLLALYMVLVVELVRRSPRLMAPFGSTSSPA